MDNKIKGALDHIRPDDDQKKRMLNNILENKKGHRIRFRRYITIAASIVVVLSSIFIKTYTDRKHSPSDLPDEKKPPIIDENLPKIQFSLSPEGMGYAGIMLYNREELISKNPWSKDMIIDRLPVYKSDLPTDPVQKEDYLSGKEKDKLARKIAKTLGVGIIETDNYHSYKCDQGITINIGPDLSASIFWDDAVKLPDTKIKDEYEKQVYYLKYYYELYRDLLNLEEAEFEVVYDYSYQGDKHYDHYVFDKHGSDQDKILNYNFNKARFGISEESNGLHVLHLPSLYQGEKIGDYPIISVDEAVSNILKGEYLTTVPYEENINREDIAKIELEYYISPYCEYMQPVYVAYIELENDRQDNGLITYGIYYTPAISKEYVNIVFDEVHFN